MFFFPFFLSFSTHSVFTFSLYYFDCVTFKLEYVLCACTTFSPYTYIVCCSFIFCISYYYCYLFIYSVFVNKFIELCVHVYGIRINVIKYFRGEGFLPANLTSQCIKIYKIRRASDVFDVN